MVRITEGYEGVFNLFFSFVRYNEDGSAHVSFIKGKPGNSVATGFAFDVPEIKNWGELEDFFLQDEMLPFWVERNGFHIEKYFNKIALFWDWLPGAPKVAPMNLSGKTAIPSFEKKIMEKWPQIKFDSYESY